MTDEREGDEDKLDIRVWLNKRISWLGSYESNFTALMRSFNTQLTLEPPTLCATKW